ncbi:MAG: G5 domain-containing protein [Phototrophicaceae bacterium]
MNLKNHQWLLFCLVLFFGACRPTTQTETMIITLIADGRERTFAYPTSITVAQFLQDSQIELADLDRVNPQPYTQLTNGMIVTVVRVQETTECEEVEIPYSTQTILNEGLQPSEERLGQGGSNGIEKICYRISIENGIPQPRVEISRVVISAPMNEIIYVGPSGQLDPVNVEGTLAYINNRNIWVIQGNSLTKKNLTNEANLDEHVFELSGNGGSILFTRHNAEQSSDFSNELWVASDFQQATPTLVKLVPENVLHADWFLDEVITYSTAEASETAPGWRAYNDLWRMQFDPTTGASISINQLVEPSSFGLYSWWGTRFEWSPSREILAWVRADSIGIYDTQTNEYLTLAEYPVFNTRQSWSWRANTSFSPDEKLILSTFHIAIGNYPPETSPAFSVGVASVDGTFSAELMPNTGIWSNPQFTPPQAALPRMAYLRSKDPFNSINSAYELVVADQDGSNSRVIFPKEDNGLEAQEFAWSPSGEQIAVIYQGNLWIVDVQTDVAHQLTQDGGARQPIWR